MYLNYHAECKILCHLQLLQDVSNTAECKILSCKLLARCILFCRMQDIITCKMNLTLQNPRYYIASHLQDESYSAESKILSCKSLARWILKSLARCILLKNASWPFIQDTFKKTVHLRKSWNILARHFDVDLPITLLDLVVM